MHEVVYKICIGLTGVNSVRRINEIWTFRMSVRLICIEVGCEVLIF